MKLEYYVYYYNFNEQSIKKFNVFNHDRFLEAATKNLRKCETKKEFAEELRKDLAYYFWSKAEWEVVVTSWVPHITMSELDRLNEEREDSFKKYNREPYRLDVNPDVNEKIDVYEQVMLNWNLFVDYVWSYKKIFDVSNANVSEVMSNIYAKDKVSQDSEK